MQLYFAYGSNMDETQMRERCPGAALIGTATLKNYRLAFTIFSPKRQCGCADVVPSKSDTVYGLLYTLTDADAHALDDFEGCPVHYHRISVSLQTTDGPVVAYTYEVVAKRENLLPSSDYLGLIQTAAAKYAFPKPYQDFLQSIVST